MGNNQGMLLLFSGPSGVGKDTVLELIHEKNKELQRSVSLTTREQRQNEIDGVDYHFVSYDRFMELVNTGKVLEFAQYGQNLYGTPKEPVDKWLDEGKTVILKIEVQGAAKIREIYPDAISIFLMPPSMEELESRIRNRGTENEDGIMERLSIARKEIKHCVDYDFIVVNDDSNKACDDVLDIIKVLNFTYKRMNNYIREVIKNV
ncbi:MAG: guanylate kinase [Clostridiales bacterium]|nr:guanylate kinase [Clostridiales bacterium]